MLSLLPHAPQPISLSPTSKASSLLPLCRLWWLIEEPKDFPGCASDKEPLLPTSAGDRETWVQSLDQGDPLEEGMATHSSIFA